MLFKDGPREEINGPRCAKANQTKTKCEYTIFSLVIYSWTYNIITHGPYILLKYFSQCERVLP